MHCFNSTLVQLKVFIGIEVNFCANRFQFHIGSIKRRTRSHLAPPADIRFNSTLVQLKVPIKNVRDIFIRMCFNSTLVQLKVQSQKTPDCEYLLFQFHIGSIKRSGCQSCHALDICRFNSTLVQLKVNYPLSPPESALRFQFHIGSIKSNDFNLINKSDAFVSIPHWFN